jgi:SAM-dependent methyltransferase
VAHALARYDEFAEWYERWIGGGPPLIAAQPGLLPAVAGQRVLDIGCGQGRMSRYLAGLGAAVTGVDISAAMLGKARALGPAGISPDGVRIRVGATHRTLSTVLNALLGAGLDAEYFAEPPAPVPLYLLWRCRRR